MSTSVTQLPIIRIAGVAYVYVQTTSRDLTPVQLEKRMSEWIPRWWSSLEGVSVGSHHFEPHREVLREPYAVASPYGVTLLLSVRDSETSRWQEWLDSDVLPKLTAAFPDLTIGKFVVPAA